MNSQVNFGDLFTLSESHDEYTRVIRAYYEVHPANSPFIGDNGVYSKLADVQHVMEEYNLKPTRENFYKAMGGNNGVEN